MSGKKRRYLEGNRINTKKILVLSILLFNILFIPFLNNLNINRISHKNEQTYKDIEIQNLKTQDLTSDNTFSGVGAPWNVTHYANRTKTNLAVSFYNNSYNANQEIELDSGWMGYQLNSTIKNLYITRNLVNGTFHAGTYVGGSPSGNDDSAYIVNWTFGEYDPDTSNTMSGNYYDENYVESDYQDCLELRMYEGGSPSNYDTGDRCWWNSDFTIPDEEIEEASIYLAINPEYADEDAGHFTFRIKINDTTVMSRNLYSLFDLGGSVWRNEEENIDNVEEIFPTGANNANITLEFVRTGGSYGGYGIPSYGVLVDNVSLIVKAKAKPTEIELKLNNKQINDDIINNGEGSIGILGAWNGTEQSSVIANFSCNLNWPLVFNEDGNLISYKIDLETNLTLYINKSTPESYYRVDPDLNYQGSAFITSNNSNVNWTTYAHLEIPAGYEETNMTVEYPSDYNLTGVFFSQNPDSISQTFIKEYGNKKVVNIPVSSITSNTNGFWKLTAVSPNYCSEMGIYNNDTGSWVQSNEFFSGEYINITASINKSQLISGYIQQTNAQLQIKFPNGTIWTGENQVKQVSTTGMVYFDPILIPFDEPNYEVGDYLAIVTWNNSYSSFNLNETGIIYKLFGVNHNSSLIPDEYYYSNIYEEDTVNLKVSFFDPKNDKPIEDANVFLTNFTGGTQYFNEINPGYYLLIFNTSGGDPGENNLTIYATHPSYQSNEVNITIEVIAYTSLTAEEYPSIEVPWNNNFTVHLNYTATSDDSGVENANPTVNWNGDFSIKSGNGLYNLTCNTSKYLVNTAPNLRIEFNEIGYESQTIILSIEVVERETYIDEIFINNDDCTLNKSYNVNSGELVNITLKYKDNDAGGALIHDAMVTLNGTNIGEIFTDNINFYNLTLNCSKLSVGISFLNLIANKNNYTAITELLTINVYERETNYSLYLNGMAQGQNPSIQLYKNQFLNITLTYKDTLLNEHIPSAIVDINGSGISEPLDEAFNNYSVLINTNDLNQGVNFLTIFARKDNYKAYSISLVIQIIQIETNLTLFINGEDITSNPSITRYPNEILNITISYDTSILVNHILGAIVDINGSGISEPLDEAFNNYSVLINTNDLNQGVNFLTIFARKDGYDPQTISLVIEIIQIETELILKINSNLIVDGGTIQVEADELINVTIYYRDNETKQHITGAIVDLVGRGQLDETNDYYNRTINAAIELDQGITILTIFAQLINYEPQSIRFFIEVVERSTNIQLLLNGIDKTLEKVLDVTIGKTLNITVKYTDNQTGDYVLGALVQLEGEGLLLNFTRDDILEQHYLILDTKTLSIGVKLFSIVAQANNYKIQTIDPRITVKRIHATINLESGGSQIETEVGEDVLIQINLNDTVFGGFILNATVTYRWAYGQGELEDPDNNGIYEVSIENVPVGAYPITITAFAGDDYDFETYIITLVVSPSETPVGPDLSWLIYVLIGAIAFLSVLFTLYQTHFKYPPMVRKIRKLKKKVRKGKKSKSILVSNRDEIISSKIKDRTNILAIESIPSEKDVMIEKIPIKKEDEV